MTKGYERRECFASKPASFPTGSKQSWLNIAGTMAARSHFLLGNKAPSLHSVFLGQPGCRDNCLAAATQTLHQLC